MQGEALAVARVLRQPAQRLYVYVAAYPAVNPRALELHMHDPSGYPLVTGTAPALVLAAPKAMPAAQVFGILFRRRKVTIHAMGAPSTP